MAIRENKALIADITAAKTVYHDMEIGQTLSISGVIAAEEVTLFFADRADNEMGPVVDQLGTSLVLSAATPGYTVNGPFRCKIVKPSTTGAVGVYLER